MAQTATLERLLKRDRAVTLFGLTALCACAWLYLLTGAGIGMSAWQMSRLALLPHTPAANMANMPGMAREFSDGIVVWALMLVMWWVMMIAMMLPSAAPAILLYARIYRHALAQGQRQGAIAPTGAFATGYFLIWLLFSLVAALLYRVLERSDGVSAITMASQSMWLSAGVLFAAGLYQFSPVKNACLSRCRSPASFLAQQWRPGMMGALRLGALHGAYCVGCCWLMMALLFVGGVMNLAWIAMLTLLVLVEKLAPAGPWVGRGAGIVLIGWGIATLAV